MSEFFARSPVEVRASLGRGFESMRVSLTSDVFTLTFTTQSTTRPFATLTLGSSACAELYGDAIRRKLVWLPRRLCFLSRDITTKAKETFVMKCIWVRRTPGEMVSQLLHPDTGLSRGIHNQNKCHNRVEEEWTRRVAVEVVLLPLHLVVGALLRV